MSFKATYLGSNGWIIEFSNAKVVIDPWIKGDLVFPPGEWFFKGNLKNELTTPINVNLLLLTQGLPDHSHIESLKQFNKSTKIVCSESSYSILKEIGFYSIEILKPSEKLSLKDFKIEATAGAPVPNTENGYIVEHSEGSFYIEPHGFLDKEIRPRRLDAVITPTKNLKLPLFGSFVKGAEVVPELIKKFEPKFILESTVGGDAVYSGILNTFISVESFKEKLECQLLNLSTMESVLI